MRFNKNDRTISQPFMQSILIYMYTILFITLCFPGIQQAKQLPIYPEKVWKTYNTPEEAGWSSSKLKKVQDYSNGLGSAAVLVIHDGKIVTSWGDIEYKFKAQSIRKTFLFALYGIHVNEGHIDFNKTMADLRIDDIPPLTENEKKSRIIDLLKCRSGVYHHAAYVNLGKRKLWPKRDSHARDTFWFYNNWDFNTLLTIFEQETGTKIFEEFYKRIAIPLQMEHFQVSDGSYFFEKRYSIHPAYPFLISALDMARFGLLYLRDGKWKDKQIIPKKWIKKEITPYSIGRHGYGYGFKWNIVNVGKLGNLGAFYSSGFGGQKLFILPKLNIVFVHRGDCDGPPNRRLPQRQIETILEGILAANSKFGFSQPEEIHSFRNDESIKKNVIKTELAQFPKNIIYQAPSAEIPAKFSALIGQWEGKWGKHLHSFLIIDKVDLENISFTFGWGTYSPWNMYNSSNHYMEDSPWKMHKGSNHYRTKLEISNDGRSKFEFDVKIGKLTFYLNKDLETIEGYYRDNYIRMLKTATPTLTK